MSFSLKVKTEISKHKIYSNIEALIELSAILKTNASISIRNAIFNIDFITENLDISKRIYKLINKIYDYEPLVTLKKNDNIQSEGVFLITIGDEKIVESLLTSSGIDYYGNFTIDKEILFQRLNDENGKKKAAHLKGAFLGAGTIVSPEKSYHLEMIFSKLEDYEFTRRVVDSLGLKPLLNIRKDKFVLYYKDSDKISDFLSVIGATNSMLELENIKAMKELRNQINRQVNCDTANINKTIASSEKIINEIRYIEEEVGLNNLPDQLKDIAKLRIENPEVSIKELGQLLDPPLSKSGTNHRLKKLSAMYEDIKSKKK